MELTQFIPYYPSIEDVDFFKKISAKNEFINFKLSSMEEIPSERGQLLRHQELLSRFLSSHTLYDSILIIHEMGTGKSCTASAIINKVLEEQSQIKKVLYLTRRPGLLNNFRKEFVQVCSKENSFENDKIKFLTTMTFTKFAKHNFKGNFSKYDNTIIILDEIHNLRETGDSQTYDFFMDFLHRVRNCKILLMSGTPMKDTSSEIISVLNLILPTDKQLLIKDVFGDNDVLTNEGRRLLKNSMKGRVSYLKKMNTPNITTTFKGEIIKSKFKYFKLITDEMVTDGEQFKRYQQSFKDDANEGLHYNRSQSILFGTSGTIEEAKKSIQRGKDVSEKLNILKNYSSKYSESIKTILDASTKGKNVFVYNKYVQNMGLKLFSNLLRMFGFSEANGTETTKGKRYMLLTGSIETDKKSTNKFMKFKNRNEKNKIEKLLKRFNNDDNKNGDFISVILGSPSVSEGYTFKNVQLIDIHTPWFNYSTIVQSIARGVRLGSHKALLEDLPNVDVEVYQRATLTGVLDSVDVNDYVLCESKDVNVKKIEQILKEEAIDCAFTYERNKKDSSFDYSRECEYNNCEYKCNSFIPKNESDIDFSTYNLYYLNPQYMIDTVKSVFAKKSCVTLHELLIATNTQSNVNKLLESMEMLISSNELISDNMGLKCLLRETNNVFYLVNHLVDSNTLLDSYYERQPHVDTSEIISLSDVDVDYKNVIVDIYNTTTIKDLIFKMRKLSSYDRELVLESNLNLPKPNELINEYFFGYYQEKMGVIYSWYLLSQGILRSKDLEDNVWESSGSDFVEYFKEILKSEEEIIKKKAMDIFKQKTGEEEPDAYYGLMRYTDDVSGTNNHFRFCLKKIDKPGIDKLNQQSKGQNYLSYQKTLLSNLISSLKIDVSMYPKFPNISKNISGTLLFNFFKENNILIRDEACGKR